MIDFSNTKELIVFILFAVLSVAFTVCGVNVSRKNVEVESGRVICTFALCTLVPILFFAVICAINLFEPFGLGIITQGKECSLLRGDNVLFTVPFGGGFIKIVCTRPIIKFFIMETLLMIVIILFAVPIRRTSSAIVAGHDGDGYIMVGSSSSLRLQPEVDYSSQSYVSGQIYVSDEHLPNIRRTEPLPPSTTENSELPIFAASQPIDELEAAYYREYFSDVYDHIPYYQTSLSSLSETNENDDKKIQDSQTYGVEISEKSETNKKSNEQTVALETKQEQQRDEISGLEQVDSVQTRKREVKPIQINFSSKKEGVDINNYDFTPKTITARNRIVENAEQEMANQSDAKKRKVTSNASVLLNEYANEKSADERKEFLSKLNVVTSDKE